MSQAKRVVLVSRPVGEPKPSDFRIEDYAMPTPGDGEVLLRTIWLSLDPYMRGRMSDGPSYAAPVPIGGVMEGGTVGEVIASNNPGFAKGDIVLARAGWQTHALSDGKGLNKIDPKLGPVSAAVGVLGMPGMTAYTGLLDIGKPQAGETVVVAAASGLRLLSMRAMRCPPFCRCLCRWAWAWAWVRLRRDGPRPRPLARYQCFLRYSGEKRLQAAWILAIPHPAHPPLSPRYRPAKYPRSCLPAPRSWRVPPRSCRRSRSEAGKRRSAPGRRRAAGSGIPSPPVAAGAFAAAYRPSAYARAQFAA